MGLLDELKKLFAGAGKSLQKAVKTKIENPQKKVTFESLPADLEAFKRAPGSDLKDPYKVVALAVVAYGYYPADHELCFAALDYLRGPRPLSEHEKSFIRDRFFDGKDYVPRSYFEGAVPANNYTPSKPYTVTVSENPYSRQNEGYLILYVQSGGTDSPRPVTLRQKASTQEWFLWEAPGILADIRIPVSADPWA